MDTTTLLWTVTNSNFLAESQWLYGVIGRSPYEKINTSKTVKILFNDKRCVWVYMYVQVYKYGCLTLCICIYVCQMETVTNTLDTKYTTTSLSQFKDG